MHQDKGMADVVGEWRLVGVSMTDWEGDLPSQSPKHVHYDSTVLLLEAHTNSGAKRGLKRRGGSLKDSEAPPLSPGLWSQEDQPLWNGWLC